MIGRRPGTLTPPRSKERCGESEDKEDGAHPPALDLEFSRATLTSRAIWQLALGSSGEDAEMIVIGSSMINPTG
jgi:hypothetical protein